MKKAKSKPYLDYVGNLPCVVTGTYNVDCHHEVVTRRFKGTRKNLFDFGTIPLNHYVHLGEREQWGRKKFWEHYGMDPVQIVVNQLYDYLDSMPEDEELARAALEMVIEDNDLEEY